MASDEDGEAQSNSAYRARLINSAGRVEMTVGIMATTETEAVQQVIGLTADYVVELFDGTRLVMRLPRQSTG